MKQFKMPSKREFQAMYPPENDAFDCAVRATIDALPENSPNRMRVKRKMSVGLAAAVILVLALTCAAVAAGRFWKAGGANRQQRLFGIVSRAG